MPYSLCILLLFVLLFLAFLLTLANCFFVVLFCQSYCSDDNVNNLFTVLTVFILLQRVNAIIFDENTNNLFTALTYFFVVVAICVLLFFYKNSATYA